MTFTKTPKPPNCCKECGVRIDPRGKHCLTHRQSKEPKCCVDCDTPFPSGTAGQRLRCEACNTQRIRSLNRSYHLGSYGLTSESYDLLLTKQNGRCAICNNLPSGKGKNGSLLLVDHRHSDSRVRGLLCRDCNVGIGHFKEDVNTLTSAITYLQADFH